jgi:peptidoglycan-associated lipoprotein
LRVGIFPKTIQFLPPSADTVCGVVQSTVEADMSARSVALTTSIALLLGACTFEAEKQAPLPKDIRAGEVISDTFGEKDSDRVFFAYDSAAITHEYENRLRRAADWLGHYPAVKVTIEGHADERGTREYNLALGDRRATAVQRALIALGVAADRLSTVSYGKERPAATGSTEAAWSQNRRAVMVIN